MGMWGVKIIVMLTMGSILIANPAIMHSFGGWVRGQFQGAVHAERTQKAPEYVLQPGKKPTKNTTLTYTGKNKTLTYDGSKAGNTKANYGISIDNTAPRGK